MADTLESRTSNHEKRILPPPPPQRRTLPRAQLRDGQTIGEQGRSLSAEGWEEDPHQQPGFFPTARLGPCLPQGPSCSTHPSNFSRDSIPGALVLLRPVLGRSSFRNRLAAMAWTQSRRDLDRVGD